MLWKKSRMLVEDLRELFKLCSFGIEEFGRAQKLFYSDGCCDPFLKSAEELKVWEDRADQQVVRIKSSLFGNFLLPEAREDIARLLNSTDDIIDSAMHAVKFISLRKMVPIPELLKPADELFYAVSACFQTYRSAAELLFAPHEGRKVQALVEECGRYESMCDEIENRMITEIYKLPVDPFTRILYSELIRQIGDIANAAEDAAAIVGIMNLKRVV